ncbi:MAG: hypothetical protein HY534_07705 [Chloroflexi bacterium]|nr:hypothetical protein [Chloroflexota bacterium]
MRFAVPPEAETVVGAAQGDLQERVGVPAVSIEVRSVAATDWPDASLGCPEPDRFYSQVVTPGYRIILVIAGQEYLYHASLSRVVWCPSGRAGPA